MVDLINLTDQERDKFAAYCRQEAESANMMAEQMAKGKMPSAVMDSVSKKYRTEAAAHMIVGKYLASWQKLTIS